MPYDNIVIEAIFGPSLLGIRSEYGKQLLAKCKTRKTFTCPLCETNYPAKTIAYRPVTNGYNRMDRICIGCVGILAAKVIRAAQGHKPNA